MPQAEVYLVLSPSERAKGFVRPVRRTYVHVGVRPTNPTRPLTSEEADKFSGKHYVVYEAYPPEAEPLVGRFWTTDQLESGCGTTTTMALDLAETYARNPSFYGATYCTTCRMHRPVGEFLWVGTDDLVGS